jgi:hypothetical protein
MDAANFKSFLNSCIQVCLNEATGREEMLASNIKKPSMPVKPSTPTQQPTSTPPTASTTPSTPSTPVSRQQELNALRQASARATMAGPSREAQALMSQRTKNILGSQKLETGVRAQQEVGRMKSQVGMPKPEAPTSTATTRPEPPKTTTATQTSQPTLTAQQQKLYQQAYANRNNPLAKGRIQSELSKMTPEQRKVFQQYAQSQGQGGDWGGYKFEQVIILNYLISEGYADNEKSARFIVENMSDNWKQSIIGNL